MKYTKYIIVGLISILLAWQGICLTGIVSATILPSPITTALSLRELVFQDYIISAMMYSLKLNYIGYLEAIAMAIPLGFLFGLSPRVRYAFSKYIDAIRYIPLASVTGLFISGFGIGDVMKIQFLAFSIFVFLLPTVVQRIDEISSVHVDTAKTLGATKFQTIYTVYIPSVLSRVSDDIRVLVAISWTYLTIAELVNKTNGLGALAYTATRQSRIDKVFMILIIIALIGILQDRLFKLIDKLMFPYKHV